MRTSSVEYRPDIDGLRALAILGVLVYHLEGKWLPGGFVGVDVFFVISGFLITSIINRELDSGTFSLAGFYERRIRRICPALFVMIAVTAVAGVFLLFPEDYRAFGKSVKYTALSISNVHFLRTLEDYFGGEGSTMPLMHTWSLGVEEQFYIVFPFLMLALHRFGKSTVTVFSMLGGLAAVSLVASAHRVAVDPAAAFFLLPFRAWELLMGSMLCRLPRRPLNPLWSQPAGIFGLALIAGSMVWIKEGQPFPGLRALFPCAGAALVIAAGQDPRCWSRRALSWKPLVGLGLISYPVYLWHWPLYVFVNYWLPWSAATLIGTALGSLLLGFLSWRYVERPFRTPGSFRGRKVFYGWAAATALMVAAALLVVKTEGLPSRFSPEVLSMLSSGRRGKTFVYSNLETSVPEEAPVYGAPGASPTIAFWGDSHMMALLPVLDAMGRETGRAFKHFAIPGVPPVVGVTPRGRKHPARISKYSSEILRLMVADPAIETIVLHARWDTYCQAGKNPPGYFERTFKSQDEMREYYQSKLRDEVMALLDASKTVVLVYPVPNAGTDVPKAFAKKLVLGTEPLEVIADPGFVSARSPMIAFMDSLGESGRIIRIRPDGKMLGNGHLRIMANGQPLYRDDNHLSVAGAFYLKDLFTVIFQKRP